MRNLLFAFAAAACLLPPAGMAAASDAPITDVLLYPGGATITRAVQINPGMTQAVIAGLPDGFDMETLRAEAGAGVHIGEITSTVTAKADAVNPAEAALEAKITALRDEEALLDADAKSAQMVVDYLARLGGSETAASDARRVAPMDGKALTGMAGAMGAEAGKALAKIQKVSVQKRDVARKMVALQRDLARLRSGTRDTRTLSIALTAQRAGVLTISYQVNNAGWKPAYRASLSSEASTLELERQAIISQKTGEDWSNVRLTLSTTQPRRATGGPDPQPWLLAYLPPRVYSSDGRKDKEDALAQAVAPAELRMAGNYAAAPAAPAPTEEAGEDTYAPPSFEIRGMFSSEFKVAALTTLPSDGREVSVALGKQDIAVKQYLRAAPRQETAAYLTAEADRPQGDWPPGTMQLFRDGSYVGSSEWNPMQKERLVLGFGRDPQMHVLAVPLKGDTGSSGIFGKREQKKIGTAFNFTNHHKRPVKLLVLEASPVATSDEIKVRTAFDPKPAREMWEDRRGVVAWELTLAPGETSKIKTEYEIEFPGEGRVPGLP